MLGEYNHSVLCYEQALQAQPGFEQALRRKHSVLCQQKLEQRLEAQHRYPPPLLPQCNVAVFKYAFLFLLPNNRWSFYDFMISLVRRWEGGLRNAKMI